MRWRVQLYIRIKSTNDVKILPTLDELQGEVQLSKIFKHHDCYYPFHTKNTVQLFVYD